MLDRFHGRPGHLALEPVADASDISKARAVVDRVRVEAPVRDYLLTIVAESRRHEQVRLGASPRASLALQQAAQASAALAGRDFVLPDDIKALAAAVLSHRLITAVPARLRGVTGVSIVTDILDSVAVPIEA